MPVHLSVRPPVSPSGRRFDILGLGNAIVDVVASAPEDFLAEHKMVKGTMQLIDAATAERLYAAMPAGIESSGGSAANTCAVAAGLGARVGFLGKVADDQLGQVFRHDIAAAGVHFPTPPLTGDTSTARCLILVTPDGQRTMNTFLGACVTFSEADLDAALIEASDVVYLEGFLFDPPPAQAAFHAAARMARAGGSRVALSLSDPFCVGRHRAAFHALLPHIDILFANEAEIQSLYETADFATAAERARRDVPLAVLTRSEHGSLILHGVEQIAVPAAPAEVLDTTGAGDAYAAGFLAGHAAGHGLAASGWLGSRAAAAVIGQYGGRPRVDLRELIAS